VTGIALGHHVGRLEHGVGDLGHGELLVVGLLGRDDRRVRGEHEVDARVGHQVGLELSHIDVEGTIETKGSSERGHDLTDETVEVGVGRSLDVEGSSAHVVEGLVIEAEGAVGVLQEGVRGKHVVVRLNDGGGDLRGRGHGEGELGLTAVVDGKSLEEERAEARSSSTTGGVEDEEALEPGTVVGELSDAVEAEVNNLLADGVVTTGIVVGGILLTRNELLRVVELSVGAGSHLVERSRLKIEVNSARDMLASTSLRKEGVESVVATTDGLVGRHLSIRLDT
jgi:hypothetical protein